MLGSGVHLTLACGVLAIGCGSDAPACPNDLPSGCPAPAPSYRTEVAPLFQGRCFPCHGPGGVAQPKHDFTSYAVIHDQRSKILNQVYNCRMPPAQVPAPTMSERTTLLDWLVCGAPDN